MITYLILFGSNIEPEVNLETALDKLRDHPHMRLDFISNVYESPMVLATGETDMNRRPFLNAAITVKSDLNVAAMRDTLRRLESELGRVRGDDKFADRPVDLDILAAKSKEGILEIGSELQQHAHAALPSAEIVPEWIVDSTGLTLGEIADGFKMENTLIRRKR